MEKKTLGKGLEDISNVFLSKGVEEEKEEMHGNEIVEGENAVLAEGNCEVRELVTVHRKIAYPNSENSQQDVRQALSTHLEEGYHIRSVTLSKITMVEGPVRREKREEVTIYVKAS